MAPAANAELILVRVCFVLEAPTCHTLSWFMMVYQGFLWLFFTQKSHKNTEPQGLKVKLDNLGRSRK
jgi:hypothetical protein